MYIMDSKKVSQKQGRNSYHLEHFIKVCKLLLLNTYVYMDLVRICGKSMLIV